MSAAISRPMSQPNQAGRFIAIVFAGALALAGAGIVVSQLGATSVGPKAGPHDALNDALMTYRAGELGNHAITGSPRVDYWYLTQPVKVPAAKASPGGFGGLRQTTVQDNESRLRGNRNVAQ